MDRLFIANIFLFLLSISVIGAEQMKHGEWIPVISATKINGPEKYGNIIGSCHEGGWVEFGPFEFSEGFVDRLEVCLAAPNSKGIISLRLDEPEGSAVASVEIQDTGGFNEFVVLAGDAEQLAGKHKMYMTFGGENLCNVKEFCFLKSGQKGSAKARESKKQSQSSSVSAIVDKALAPNNYDILKNRTVKVTIYTPPLSTVQIKQVRHAFQFGTAISRKAFLQDANITKADQDKYKQIILQNFNSVVHENAMKWYSNEREKGKQRFEAADAMLEWSEKNGLYTRGHCVFWGREKCVQEWIKELDDAALRQKLQERAKVYMERYKGRVPEHDINNEMVHCTYYKDRLGDGIWKQMFDWCHQYYPGATLYVNDYSILSGGDTEKYMQQIKGFLEDGMKVGGIGVQGHFGGRVNGNDVKQKLDHPMS